MLKSIRLAFLAFGLAFFAAFAGTASAEDFNAETATGMAALQKWYNGGNGQYNTTGWWNSANALEATIDYMRYSGSKTYLPILDRTYTVNHNGNFFNNFYDDEGWWALAWVKAYDLTGNAAYLNQAKTIFNDMAAAWDTTCGGGIWWSKDRQYKASIANELFFQLAARLHNRTSGDTNYLNWANKEWNWFKNSGLIRSDNTVQDGIHKSGCSFSNYVASYNQGVIIGALVELNRATGDASLISKATSIANATVNSNNYSPNGILKAPCGNGCTSADLVQFDGIFLRNLKVLADATNNASYRTYMTNNAHSIWANDRNGSNQFGVDWAGPFDKADAARQSSALDALNTQVTASGALQNLALGKSSSSNGSACSTGQGSASALDGSLETKWCQSGGGGQSLTVDLGSSQTVSEFVVYHANAGGEASNLNTKDFNIQTSTDNANWSTRVTVTGNTSSITTHTIAGVTARYVRLNIVTAQSSTTTQSARIYDFQVMGPGTSGATAVTYEAESLPVAGTSGDVERIAADTGYSGGNGVILEANAAGDYVSFTVNVPEARTYDIRVGIKKDANRGMWQFDSNGVNHGNVIDGYASAADFTEVDLGGATFNSAGTKTFKFTVTGKNGSSSGHWIALDYIKLIPQ